MSATPGARGGIGALQQLKAPLEAMQMFVFHRVFPLAHSHGAFENGALLDQKQRETLSAFIESYVTFTRKLSAP